MEYEKSRYQNIEPNKENSHGTRTESEDLLYGSRSRGTAKSNSDWDLLILLNKEKITPEDEQKIIDPLYDLEFDTGEVISPIIYSEKEWNTKYKITPFYHNVMREGRLL